MALEDKEDPSLFYELGDYARFVRKIDKFRAVLIKVPNGTKLHGKRVNALELGKELQGYWIEDSVEVEPV